MALSIADGLFVGATISKFPEYRCWMPIFVFFLLDGLNPVVRNTHRHAIVEAHTALLEWQCQARHTAHFFGYGDSLRIKFVNKLICKGEIYYGVNILTAVVVVAISTECLSEAVVVI